MTALIPGVYTCGACGLTHPKVEAGGIYYCPNPLCTGCGGNSHRLPYTNAEGTDVQAWVVGALALEVDPKIVEARDRQLLQLTTSRRLDHPAIVAHLERMARAVQP